MTDAIQPSTDPTATPVGHFGSRVDIREHPAWAISGWFGVLVVAVCIAGAVLLAPGILRGGIKTKVSEAFANGCAVIGNDITFEGFRLENYPLLASNDEELNNFIAAPASYLDRMRSAAVLGQDYVRSCLSREQFRKNWNDVLG